MLVAEKRAHASEAGAGLQLSPNASHLLIRWGLGPQLAETAVAPSKLSIRRWHEPRAYADVPMETAPDGAPFWVMLRADLHKALLAAAMSQPAVTCRNGLTLVAMRDEGSLQRIRFDTSSGEVEFTADVVIGADGGWSRIRQALGDSRNLDPAAWEAWRTLIPAAKTLDFIRAAATNLWLGRHSHAVHYPVAAGTLINLVVIRRSRADEEGWDRVGDPARLADLAATAAPTLKELMSLAPSWAVWTVRDRAPAVRLAKGPLAVVGDAAHPLLPFLAQGAAMAIEDAAVLAASLPPPDRLTAETATPGLAAYAKARGQRVHRVFHAARQNAFAYHLPPALAWFRDRKITRLGPDGMRKRYSWVYDWRAEPDGG